MLSIETSILKSLLYDGTYVEKVMPFLKESYFDGPHQTLFSIYKDIYDATKGKKPNLQAIGIKLSQFEIDEGKHEEIMTVVNDILKTKNDIPDTDWFVKETESYCRDKSFNNAMYDAFDIVDGKNKKMTIDAIPDMLQEALNISFDNSIGMDFFEDAGARYDLYVSEDARIPYPLEALQAMSNGGHKKKTLSCVVAGVNVGKTAIMCYLAGELLRAGKNVLYITLEMSEEDILQRIEANLFDKTTDEIEGLTREEYLSYVEKIKAKTMGKLITKQYPTGQGHVGHFRALLKEIKNKKKVNIDFVFVDYINICASYRYSGTSGMNSYSIVKSIAEELRGLAVEFDLPIMTGTQFTRDGMTSMDPDMTKTSESIGLPQTLDFYFAAVTNETLAENNHMLFVLLKTRWGNKKKVANKVVGIDYDHMRLFDVNVDVSEQNEKKELENLKKNRLLKKNKEKKKDSGGWNFDDA